MPWRPLPQIAFGIAKCPFTPVEPTDLPLELGDELYIIEEGGQNYGWYRGYLVAPPSLLAGLTSIKGQALEARVFSGIFPRNCVEIKEYLGDAETSERRLQGRSRTVSESQHSLSEKKHDTTQNGILPLHKDSLSGANGTAIHQRHPSKASQRSLGASVPIVPNIGPDGKRIRPPAPVPMLKIGDETPTSANEPLIDEIASCLREWNSTNLHELLLSRQYTRLDRLSTLVKRLDIARRQLMQGVLTEHELEKLRLRTVWDMVKGTRMLSNDVVVRDSKLRGRLLTERDDPIEIAKLQSTMSLLTDPPKPIKENFNLHHLLVEPRELLSDRKDSPRLVMYLATRTGDGPLLQLSESFMVDIPDKEQHSKVIHAGKLRTLFTNLSASDVGSAMGSDTSIFLVVKVQVNYAPQADDLNQAQRPPTGKDNRRDTAALPAAGGNKVAARRSILFGSRGPGNQPGKNDAFELDEEARASAATLRSDGQRSEATQFVKKYVGVGLIALEDLLSKTGESEHTISIWSPDKDSQSAGPWHGWNKVLEQTLVSPHHRWSKLEGLRKIHLHLLAFASPDEETLIRKTPTLLHNIAQTPKIGFSGVPLKPRSDIYVTISEAVIAQAASFLHPEKGGVELPGRSEMRNLQLTLEVRTNTGERIPRCIYTSSDSLGQTAWRSTAISKGEKWCQTIRLDIPPEAVPYAHIIMSIAEFSDFPFALAWMPLWANGAFIRDGEHFASLHVYDQTTSGTTFSGRGAYLDLPWDSRAREQRKIHALAGPVASLKVQTFLCSTHSSQDQTLLRILNWREESDDQLIVLLRQLVFVPEIELVKLISDVLDALFGIMVDQAGDEECEDLAFTALVTVLGIMHDRRFRLEPLVNDYAESRFDFPEVVPCLIQSYLRLIGAPADYQNSRKLRAAFKVGRHILKFIIMARKQQLRRESYTGITSNSQTSFNMELKSVFLGFEKQMQEESAAHIGSKTMIVQHMHTWLPELAPCFTHDQILKAAASFLESCSNVDGKLILHRLVLILNVVKLALEKPSDYLSKFKERVVAWVEPYWGMTSKVTELYREQVRLCCSIMAEMRNQYGSLSIPIFKKTVQSYLSILQAERPTGQNLSLLFPSTYPFPTRPFEGPREFDENLIELAALKSTIGLGEAIKRPDEVMDVIEQSIDVNTSILSNEAYPRSWLTLHAFNHRSIFDKLDGKRDILSITGIPSPDDADDFNTEIWRKYFVLLLTLVRSPSLSLETFPEQKRRAVWKICGDIRERGADLLLRAWNALGWDADPAERQRYGLEKMGGYQVQYVPSLVAPIMELCLSVHEGLRKAAVEVLQAMVVSEWSLNEDLSVVQTEIIECLDNLFKFKDIGDDTQQRIFIQELSDIFEPLKDTPDKALWTAIQDLLQTIDHLLDLLFAVHAPDQNERLRTMHTLRLMEYLKSIQKQGMFVTYIHQLSTAEADAGNFTEAGMALRLHADVYPWDFTTTVEPITELALPKQTAFERREYLIFEMIKYFEEGQAWEPALACYKELAEQYEALTFDFSKLARTHRAMAKIYEQIARGHLSTPRFFRVTYRGHGFSTALRDKTFIHESANSERLSGFIERLQQEYPSAQVTSKEEETSIEGQYIQVTSVTPHRNLDLPIWQRPKVPHSTKEFLASLHTRQFSIITRRHSEKSLYRDQSVEKTVYTTMNTFPTILRRSEVKHQEVQVLDPLDTALERTLRKITELAILNQRVEHGDEGSLPSLVEAIKSSVAPLSTSSVAQYREMVADTTQSNIRDEAAELEGHHLALHIALVDFASCLRQSLSKLSGPTYSAEQSLFTRQFGIAFATEVAIIAPIPQTSPSSVPPSSTSTNLEPRSAPPFPTRFAETITTVSASKRQSRIGGIFKRSTMAVPPGAGGSDSQVPAANGHMPPPSPQIGYAAVAAPFGKENPSPPPSSRTSTQDKRSSRISMQSSEDTSQMPTPRKSDHSNSTRNNSHSGAVKQQPHYASGALPPPPPPNSTKPPARLQPNAAAKKPPGSLRRRLSNMGLGRKASKAGMLNDTAKHPALAEE